MAAIDFVHCLLTMLAIIFLNSNPLEVNRGDVLRLSCDIVGTVYRYVSHWKGGGGGGGGGGEGVQSGQKRIVRCDGARNS